MTGRTFGLIKSAAIERGDHAKIMEAIEAAGFVVEKLTLMRPMPRRAALELYAAHAGLPYHDGLIDSVTGLAGTIAMVLEHKTDDAVSAWRALMGATDPRKAKEGTIRAKFGGPAMPDNAVHGSDSPQAAAAEEALIFAWSANRETDGSIATIELDDWRATDGDRSPAEIPGKLEVGRHGYGVDIEATMPGGRTSHLVALEYDHGSLHMLIYGQAREAPLVAIHVDERGAHAMGECNGPSSRSIMFDGKLNRDLNGRYWEPAPGPEFEDWVEPWIQTTVNGHRIRSIQSNHATTYGIVGNAEIFATIDAAMRHAETLQPAIIMGDGNAPEAETAAAAAPSPT
jgi:nucleoside-diphosphate kinase